jgi:hypothetical protein
MASTRVLRGSTLIACARPLMVSVMSLLPFIYSVLILRSERSERLEGWTQVRNTRPWFETRGFAALLTMRSDRIFADNVLIIAAAGCR